MNVLVDLVVWVAVFAVLLLVEGRQVRRAQRDRLEAHLAWEQQMRAEAHRRRALAAASARAHDRRAAAGTTPASRRRPA